MILICVIDVLVVSVLVLLVLTKGLEEALPFFTFVIIVLPGESKIDLLGLFDLTSARVAIIALTVLFLLFRKQSSKSLATPKTPLRYLMALIIGWSVLSTLYSVVPTISFKTVLSQLLDYFLLYYIFVNSVRI